MNIALKCHVMLALLIVLATLSCGGDSDSEDKIFEENSVLLRSFVDSSGKTTRRYMLTAIRDSEVPYGLVVEPLRDLYAYHNVYIPSVRKIPVEHVQVLCNNLHEMREVFRSNVRPKLYLGIQLNIIAPDNSEHVAYVRASRLYREYMDEFKGYVGNCGAIVTNKEEADW